MTHQPCNPKKDIEMPAEVKCRCGSKMDYVRKEDGSVKFPPNLMCVDRCPGKLCRCGAPLRFKRKEDGGLVFPHEAECSRDGCVGKRVIEKPRKNKKHIGASIDRLMSSGS